MGMGSRGGCVPIAETAHCNPRICCCRSSSGSRGAAPMISPWFSPPNVLSASTAALFTERLAHLAPRFRIHLPHFTHLSFLSGRLRTSRAYWRSVWRRAGRWVKVWAVNLVVSNSTRLELEVRGAETSETWPRPGSVPLRPAPMSRKLDILDQSN